MGGGPGPGTDVGGVLCCSPVWRGVEWAGQDSRTEQKTLGLYNEGFSRVRTTEVLSGQAGALGPAGAVARIDRHI